jgi:5-(carboxyamino)imidazole ribonucleotide mutase
MSDQSQQMVAILAESPDAQPMLRHVADTLGDFGVAFVERVIEGRGVLRDTVAAFESAGAGVFVVANTSADPLSAAVASATPRHVLAVPLETPDLPPLASLQATTRGGPPVASLAIGKAGAVNAALLAIAVLANGDAGLLRKLEQFRADQTARVLADRLE